MKRIKRNSGTDEKNKTEFRNKSDKQEHIIDGKQVWWKKILEFLASSLAWAFILVFFAYVTYGFICLALGKTPVSVWIYDVGMLLETRKLLLIALIVLLVEIVVMIFWKEYNRLRFGKLRRRTFMPDVTTQELSELFEIPYEDLMKYQTEKIITFTDNPIKKDFKAEGRKYNSDRKKRKQKIQMQSTQPVIRKR